MFCSFKIKQIDVFNQLWNINLNTSIGPDRISSIFLKECAFILTPIIITSIFNKSLCCGYYPDNWKMSYITPVFQKGNNEINNYRSISKFSIIQ